MEKNKLEELFKAVNQQAELVKMHYDALIKAGFSKEDALDLARDFVLEGMRMSMEFNMGGEDYE